MKVVMLTYTHADRAADFDAMSVEDQQAFVAEHMDWFARHADVVKGGSEMAWPQRYTTITKGGGSAVFTDGPFPETKEFLGGYIELEVDDFDQAKQICAEWPNLRLEGNRVVVMEAAHRDG